MQKLHQGESVTRGADRRRACKKWALTQLASTPGMHRAAIAQLKLDVIGGMKAASTTDGRNP